jgi:hypothetical protein
VQKKVGVSRENHQKKNRTVRTEEWMKKKKKKKEREKKKISFVAVIYRSCYQQHHN